MFCYLYSLRPLEDCIHIAGFDLGHLHHQSRRWIPPSTSHKQKCRAYYDFQRTMPKLALIKQVACCGSIHIFWYLKQRIQPVWRSLCLLWPHITILTLICVHHFSSSPDIDFPHWDQCVRVEAASNTWNHVNPSTQDFPPVTFLDSSKFTCKKYRRNDTTAALSRLVKNFTRNIIFISIFLTTKA